MKNICKYTRIPFKKVYILTSVLICSESFPAYEGWGLNTVRHFGESVKGTWSVNIRDDDASDSVQGEVKAVEVTVHYTD